MSYLEFDLNEVGVKELPTRLAFDIATARNSQSSLIKFSFKKEMGEKFQKSLTTNLKSMKKQGRITLFACVFDFEESTTEVEYLINKFPELKNESRDDHTVSYFVKL